MWARITTLGACRPHSSVPRHRPTPPRSPTSGTAGWHDAHPGHVPEGLTARRTLEAFHERAPKRVADTTVAELDGRVVGFVMVVGDEVEQVYVGATARGTGLAATLLSEAEAQVAARRSRHRLAGGRDGQRAGAALLRAL